MLLVHKIELTPAHAQASLFANRNTTAIRIGQVQSGLCKQASLRSRERFWDIRVPKIDSIFDNSLVPRSSWSPGIPCRLAATGDYPPSLRSPWRAPFVRTESG